jgi:hypothetical protein
LGNCNTRKYELDFKKWGDLNAKKIQFSGPKHYLAFGNRHWN